MSNPRKCRKKCNPRYVKRIQETIVKAIEQYPRIMAARYDLHFPNEENMPDCPTRYHDDPKVITRFFTSLKSQIEEDIKRKNKKRAGKGVLTCYVRYVWVRELNQDEYKHHYHILLLLNQDAYRYPGWIGDDYSSVLSMVIKAWIRAIRKEHQGKKYTGCVHAPTHSCYRLNRNQPKCASQCQDLIERALYLAKEHSKDKSDGYRNFGCSGK